MQKKEMPVWTPIARASLFETVVRKFGPYSEWEGTHRPGRGLNKAYLKFTEDFAGLVGANSGAAVREQVNWAIPVLETDNEWEPGRARSAILSMAAAFEAGFIGNSHFPTLIAKRATPRKSGKLAA